MDVITLEFHRARLVVGVQHTFIGIVRVCSVCHRVPKFLGTWEGQKLVIYAAVIPRFVCRPSCVRLAKTVRSTESSGVKRNAYENLLGLYAELEHRLRRNFHRVWNDWRLRQISVVTRSRTALAPGTVHEIVCHHVNLVEQIADFFHRELQFLRRRYGTERYLESG